MGMKKGTIRGKLFTKLEAKGSMSEGPSYWLKPTDEYGEKWEEILIRKKTMLWQDDPALHPFVAKQVSVEGEIIETKDTITMDYDKISEV